MNAAWISQPIRPRKKSSKPLELFSLNSAISIHPKPAGGIKIRIETIVHYFGEILDKIIPEKAGPAATKTASAARKRKKRGRRCLQPRLVPTDHACIQERISVVLAGRGVCGRRSTRAIQSNRTLAGTH